ncbi:MAG: sulfate adenylyltransferase [Candidatus Eremiobacteraeota bacterium]|nr:sulfate adenylyltransferase [Candidatus Eremiobacteraeota bacterium]
MILPHGGKLVNRIASTPDAETELRERAAGLKCVTLSRRELNDLELIANGALSPLHGFMTRRDYEAVLDTMHLADGLVWTIPVVLTVDRDSSTADALALCDERGALRAVLEVEDSFEIDRAREARAVYRTLDRAHPGVESLSYRGAVGVGGPITALPAERDGTSLTPAETRAEFERRGWDTIVGFQTRNPIHRAHEYIQKCALEIVDGLLLHPIVGETKSDDIPAEVRLRCYRQLLSSYFPKDRVLFSTLPAAMRYAGPREAIFHALIRKNYGCTHFIVGRDHAGVGGYYGTYDAQRLFDDFEAEALGIRPLKFENAFYCRRCDSMASRKTCSHDEGEHVTLSGTAVREMLRGGRLPPKEFSRPEVAEILLDAMREPAIA